MEGRAGETRCFKGLFYLSLLSSDCFSNEFHFVAEVKSVLPLKYFSSPNLTHEAFINFFPSFPSFAQLWPGRVKTPLSWVDGVGPMSNHDSIQSFFTKSRKKLLIL